MLMQPHSLRELLEHPIVPLLQTHDPLIRLLNDIVALDIKVLLDGLLQLLYLLLVLFNHLLVHYLLLLPLFLNDLDCLLVLKLYLLVNVDDFTLYNLDHLLCLLYLLSDGLCLLFEVVKGRIV
jgi:hypothetical protein